MRIVSLGILVAFVSVSASSLIAGIPGMNPGNHYGEGRTIAESRTTKHVQGREYHNSATGTTHRRVLIYDKESGAFKGFAKTSRQKGDATTRHYSR